MMIPDRIQPTLIRETSIVYLESTVNTLPLKSEIFA
jgi:hypothetical protein